MGDIFDRMKRGSFLILASFAVHMLTVSLKRIKKNYFNLYF